MYNGKQDIERTLQFIREAEEHLARTEEQIKNGEFWKENDAASLRETIAQMREQLGETRNEEKDKDS